MIIHSVMPIACLLPEEKPLETKEFLTPHGFVNAVKTCDGYAVKSLFSTCPGDYLSGRYAPGSTYTAL